MHETVRPLNMKKIIVFALGCIPFLFVSCGDPDVNITNSAYQPKIVVQAFLTAGELPEGIKIMRNYPLGQGIDFHSMPLDPDECAVTATLNGIPLRYDSRSDTYYNNTFKVEYGKTYVLEISATIDGQKLSTRSTTTVPQKGFKILSQKHLGNVSYKDGTIDLQYAPSVGAAFYVFAFLPDHPLAENYIYDNPYEQRPDTADVIKNLIDLSAIYDCIANVSNDASSVYSYHVDFFRIKFYGGYKTIVYAGDANYKEYLFSAESVQEVDGNFHEPVPVLGGDGIGVFGSVIKDTVFFTIVQ
jgi:hypothetical protein